MVGHSLHLQTLLNSILASVHVVARAVVAGNRRRKKHEEDHMDPSNAAQISTTESLKLLMLFWKSDMSVERDPATWGSYMAPGRCISMRTSGPPPAH
jgi:hypothetical protein